jgi:hypothetical protein
VWFSRCWKAHPQGCERRGVLNLNLNLNLSFSAKAEGQRTAIAWEVRSAGRATLLIF